MSNIMSKNYAGLSRIGWTDSKEGTINYLTGEPSPDSSFNPESTEVETTTGSLYGGSSINAEIKLLSRADYDILEGFQEDDAEKYWHIEFVDGREYVSRVPINIMVNENLETNARDGLSTLMFKFVKFHSKAVFELVPSGA